MTVRYESRDQSRGSGPVFPGPREAGRDQRSSTAEQPQLRHAEGRRSEDRDTQNINPPWDALGWRQSANAIRTASSSPATPPSLLHPPLPTNPLWATLERVWAMPLRDSELERGGKGGPPGAPASRHLWNKEPDRGAGAGALPANPPDALPSPF